MLNPFLCISFYQKIFTHHGTQHYLVLQCKKHLFKKLIFDGIEMPETYFSRNHRRVTVLNIENKYIKMK